MTCYIRVGNVQQNLPAAIGTYDLLEAVAVAVARGASFWLLLQDEREGERRVWLSPALPIELFDDLDYGGAMREDRVDALVDAALRIGQVPSGLAYVSDDDFARALQIARERDAQREAGSAGSE